VQNSKLCILVSYHINISLRALGPLPCTSKPDVAHPEVAVGLQVEETLVEASEDVVVEAKGEEVDEVEVREAEALLPIRGRTLTSSQLNMYIRMI